MDGAKITRYNPANFSLKPTPGIGWAFCQASVAGRGLSFTLAHADYPLRMRLHYANIRHPGYRRVEIMTEQNIIEMLLKEANEGRYLNIVIILSAILLPVLAAWISKWLTNRKIEGLYEARLRDKDQVERLAATVKMLENKLLITQRP